MYPDSYTKLGELASHDVPLLHVCGSYDFLLQHHTLVVEDIYHRLGGRISDALPTDLSPIVDFIVAAQRGTTAR